MLQRSRRAQKPCELHVLPQNGMAAFRHPDRPLWVGKERVRPLCATRAIGQHCLRCRTVPSVQLPMGSRSARLLSVGGSSTARLACRCTNVHRTARTTR
jgi:hypothetical protein